MALEITYAEVTFKIESKPSGSISLSPRAPKEKTTSHKCNPGFPKLLLASLMILFLLLAASCLVAFIIFFQKYSQVLQEKTTLLEISQKHPELKCMKMSSTTEDNAHYTIKTLTYPKKCKFCKALSHPIGMKPETSSRNTSGKVLSCCPKDWTPFSAHCYFVSTDSKPWNKSAERCRSMAANLVVINTKEEQNFIIQHLEARSLYFVGLSDPEGQRHWQWIDHTPYNESATFWLRGEPSDNTERCVALIHRSSYKPNSHQWGWNDISCSISQHSVCEMMKIYL